MTRSSGSPLSEPLSNPERVIRRRARRDTSSSIIKVEPTTLPEEAPTTTMDNQTMEALMKATREGQGSAINQPTIAEEFEIKGQFLHMINNQCQFTGSEREDPNEHLRKFLGICALFNLKAVESEVVYLRVFPWTLTGEAKDWLDSLPEGEITTWNGMVDRFLQRFFPASKAAELQGEISQFEQKPNETLYEAWNRFGKMLRMCPQHGLNTFQKVQIFYKGVDVDTRRAIDTAAGGSIMKKTPTQAHTIINDLASHTHEWHQKKEKSRSSRVASVEASDSVAALTAQMANFGRQIEKITKEIHAIKVGCETCGGMHLTKDCDIPMDQVENVSFMNQRPNNYQGGRNNFNFNRNFNPSYQQSGPGYYRQPQPPQQQLPSSSQPQPSSEVKSSSLEDLVNKFVAAQSQTNEMTAQSFRNQQASIQNLEKEVSNISRMLAERQPGALPSDTKVNPRNEQAKAITTRSGKVLEPPTMPNVLDDSIPLSQVHDKEKKEESTPTVKDDHTSLKGKEPVQPYVKPYRPPIPYPSQLRK